MTYSTHRGFMRDSNEKITEVYHDPYSCEGIKYEEKVFKDKCFLQKLENAEQRAINQIKKGIK